MFSLTRSRAAFFAFTVCAAPAVLLAAVGQAPVWAQKPAKAAPAAKLPTAASVLDKYVTASGGAANFAKVTTSYTKATISMTAMNVSGTMEAYTKSSGKFYSSQVLNGIGKMEQGFDGKTAWSKDPVMGLRTLEGPELASVKSSIQMSSPQKYRDFYSKMEMLGLKSVDGKPAYAIRLTPKTGGAPSVQYYDVTTGLLVKSTSVQESPQGKFPVETYFSDYRTVDGVKVPFKVRALLAGQELMTAITEYKNNVPVEDALFIKPAPAAPAASTAPPTPAESAAPAAPANPATPAAPATP